jgi:hypothetical protein
VGFSSISSFFPAQFPTCEHSTRPPASKPLARIEEIATIFRKYVGIPIRLVLKIMNKEEEKV